MSSTSDLAVLVREWVSTEALSRTRTTAVVPDVALFQFVVDRLQERADVADWAGDSLLRQFTTWELEWVAAAWRSSTQLRGASAELNQYLRTTASRYRRHPHFRSEWR